MTLPINPVNIQNTGVIPSEVQRLLDRVVQGSEIGQRQQQLELEKERQKAEREKLQQAEKAHQDEKEQLARLGEMTRAFLLSMEPPTILPQGALPGAAGQAPANIGATSPFAQMLQGLRAEDVPQLLPLLQQVQGLQGQTATTTGQNLQNISAARAQADDAAIRSIVSGLETQPWSRQTIGRAIMRVAAINPGKAQQLAGTLGGLTPGYAAHINDNGTVSWVSNDPGLGVAGAPVQPKGGDVDQRKAAGYARRVLEANATMTQLERKYPNIGQQVDDALRILRASGQATAIGGRSLESILTPHFLKLRAAQASFFAGTPTEAMRDYTLARVDLGNAILRRETGATINFEELDREIIPYVPMKGMKMDAVPSIQRRRLSLGLQYADQAGVEFRPDRLTPLARRYLLRALTMNEDPPPAPVQPLRSTPGTTVVPR